MHFPDVDGDTPLEGIVFAGVLKAGGVLLAFWFLLSLLLRLVG